MKQYVCMTKEGELEVWQKIEHSFRKNHVSIFWFRQTYGCLDMHNNGPEINDREILGIL